MLGRNEGGSCAENDALLAASVALRRAADILQTIASNNKRQSASSEESLLASLVETEQRKEMYFRIGFGLLALQTFIILYCFIWFHFPVWMNHQLRWISDTCEKVTMNLCQSPTIVNGVVAMTENITTHPGNIDAVSKTMQTVIGSEVFMASMRRIMKHVLLDRDVQRIVGVSISGISKEAMKSTFSWNPNEAEEARRALINGTDDPLSETERGDEREQRGPNPLNQWLQRVLDPQKRRQREQEERRRRKEEEEEAVVLVEEEVDASHGQTKVSSAAADTTLSERSMHNNVGEQQGPKKFRSPGHIPSSKSLDALPDASPNSRALVDRELEGVAVRNISPQRRRLMRPNRDRPRTGTQSDDDHEHESSISKHSPKKSPGSSPESKSVESKKSKVNQMDAESEEQWQKAKGRSPPPPFPFAARGSSDDENGSDSD